jgi:hypothetical protein
MLWRWYRLSLLNQCSDSESQLNYCDYYMGVEHVSLMSIVLSSSSDYTDSDLSKTLVVTT